MPQEIELSGGNMNAPVLAGGRVYKAVSPATPNIHALLGHVREKGLAWVPQSFGVDAQRNKHVLSFVEGTVLHDTPDWLWDRGLLVIIARRLRQWHDATLGFAPVNADWLLPTDGGDEVICHNDFAPYNWVFEGQTFVGLIDFDTCAPGSRLWDIAYTAYRIVPLMPSGSPREYGEVSPFAPEDMAARLGVFLEAYAGGDVEYRYRPGEVLAKLQLRLQALADWSERNGQESGNTDLLEHAKMYRLHRAWLGEHEAAFH